METTSTVAHVFLLGKFEIRRADRILRAEDWNRRKAAALFQRLAYERRLLKDQAIDHLWPESDPASGANNLYRVLYSLRQILDSFLGEGTADEVLAFEDGVLRLNDAVWVDAAEFERLCAQVPDEGAEQRIARLQEALALYAGDFLPDERYAEWTLRPRETFRRLRRESTLSLAEHHLDQGDFSSGIERLSSLLASDPADEPVHRKLMRAYTLAGRRHEALRQYQACVDALASELDVPPDSETAALYDQILRGDLAPSPEPSPDLAATVPGQEGEFRTRAASTAWPLPRPIQLDAEQATFLAGREPELDVLSDALRKARDSHGSTVLIAGETGIGKTHLAMEALRMAVEAGMAPLFGAAYEQEGRLAFQPFIEAFDHFLAEQGRSLQENPITHHPHSSSADLQQEHWALFKATANFILEIAQESPLVFLVDDLHVADEASLQLFHYLARQTRAAPVVFIATYRIDVLKDTQFGNLLTALYREGLRKTIFLDSLPQEAVRKILEDSLQGQVSRELCQAVYDITAGNPLFTEELGWSLSSLETIEIRDDCWTLKPGEQLTVSDDLSTLLRQNISRLGSAVETALTAAAVLGREFRFEILRSIVDLTSGEILNALDTAMATHLVEEMPVGYRFRHPLIRRTLYESLSRVRRAYLHTRAGEAIEAIYTPRSGGLAAQTEVLAYHYDLSDRRDRALPYLTQSGENAAAVYAFDVATEYFERTLSLMDDLGLYDPALRWHLLESLGWWHGNVLADTPKAVAYFEQALALEPAGDWRPDGQDLVRVHCGAAVALITSGNMEAAEWHLQTAHEKVEMAEDAPEYSDLLYNLAQLHWHRNEYQRAFEVAQRSLAIAERLDKSDAVARAFEMLALACHSLGEWQEGIAYEQRRADLVGADLDVTDAFDVHL